MIKKMFVLVVICCFLAMPAFALEQYVGVPQLPYLVYGQVNWNNQALAWTRIQVTNEATGYSEVLATDANGYWQQDAQNWLTIAPNRPPVSYGDVITVEALDGCGTNDVCKKSFTAFSTGFEDYAVINLDLSGVLSCPPPTCPICSSGGCSGGGSVVYDCTESKCAEKFPCEDIQSCPTPTVCPEVEICPSGNSCPSCPEPIVCPEPVVCEDQDCPIQEGSFAAIISAIVAFLFGVGGSVGYFKYGKIKK